MSEEFRAVAEDVWQKAMHELLETVSGKWGDDIPSFGSSTVEVVDRVEVHVLGMPGEEGSPGSRVEVGLGDARD